MLLLGLDFESTGLDMEKDLIIEVGAVIWCTEAKAPKLIYNELVMWPTFTGLSDEIINLTGISPDDVSDYGKPPGEVFSKLLDFIKSVNAVVAHNGTGFDRPMLKNALKRLNLEEVEKPWIDTRVDVDYPKSIPVRKLSYLAAEHGFLNPFAHRAVFDVLTMLKLLSHYDLHQVIALSKEPMVTMQAICQKPWEDNSQSTNVAKKHGFRWDGEKKIWVQQLKRSLAARLQSELKELQVRIIS